MAMARPQRKASRSALFWVRLLMILAASFAAMARPAAAQSILRDAETEQLLRDISRPLIEAAGLPLVYPDHNSGPDTAPWSRAQVFGPTRPEPPSPFAF